MVFINQIINLKVGGITIAATSTELNYNAGIVPGTGAATKSLVLDSNLDITNINSLTATSLNGTIITAVQPNITSTGILTSLNVNGISILNNPSGSDGMIRFQSISGVNYIQSGVDNSSGSTADLFFGNIQNDTSTSLKKIIFKADGKCGFGTILPNKQVEINNSTGDCLRLTYNDTSNYTDLSINSSGVLSIDSSGNQIITNDILKVNNVINNFGTSGILVRSYSNAGFNGRIIKNEIITSINLSDYSPEGVSDNFSLEIIGYIYPLYNEVYTFYITSDDKVRFYIDNTLLYFDWGTANLTENASTTISLLANRWYPIYIQHEEITGSQALNVKWESTSQTKETISTTSLSWDNKSPLYGNKPSFLDSLNILNSTTTTLSNGTLSVNTSGDLLINSSSDLVNIQSDLQIGSSSLTDENIIYFTGTTGDNTKNYSVISERIYDSVEKSELLLFKGNDSTTGLGPDRIRFRSASFNFQIFSSTEDYSGLSDNNDKLVIDNSGLIGINTTTITKQVEINNSTGQCLRLKYNNTTNVCDLTLTSSGNLNINPSGSDVTINSSSLDIVNFNGTTIGLKLAGVLVTSSAAELNYNDITTIGTAEASKALIVDSNKDITGINSLTATNLTITGSTSISNLSLSGINNIGDFNNGDLTNNVEGRLRITSSSGTVYIQVSLSDATDNSADLFFGNSYTDTGASSRKFIYKADGKIGFGTIAPSLQLEINNPTGQCLRLTYNDTDGSAVNYTDFTVSSSGDLTIDASGGDIIIENTCNLNIDSHNGVTNGLMLDGTLVTATATEINYLDVTSGTAVATKALITDSNIDISNINVIGTNYVNAVNEIYSGSKIGIGTVTPFDDLDIRNDTAGFTAIRIQNRDLTPDTSGSEINFGVYRDTNTVFNGAIIRCTVKNGDIPQVKGGDLVFLTNTGYSPYPGDGFERMRITQFGVIGINTNNPAKQLEINNSVGSCLRLTRNDSDGSATTYADFDIPASGDLNITPSGTNVSVINSSLNIGNYNGSTIGLKLAGVIVTASAAELNYNDITTIGTAEASKALILDSSKDIVGINDISLSSLTSTTLITSEQLNNVTLNNTGVTTLNTVNGTNGFIRIYSASGVNYIQSGLSLSAGSKADVFIGDILQDTSTSVRKIIFKDSGKVGFGTISPNRQLDLNDSSGECLRLLYNNTLPVDLDVDVSGNFLITPSSGDVNIVGCDLDIVNFNGTTIGLKLAGVLVTASAVELNYTDVTTIGTAEASKALIFDENRDIININDLTAVNIYGTLMSSTQTNITTVGSLTGLTTTGSIGIKTTAPDRSLEINDSAGNCLRLTYNDSDGSALTYSDFNITSAGFLQLTSTGNNIELLSDIIVGDTTTGVDNLIKFKGITGDADSNHTVIGERIYETSTEKTELILFKGNDVVGAPYGPERIRCRSAEFLVQTFTSIEDYSSLNDNNNRLVVKNDGKIGINTIAPDLQVEINNSTGQCLRLVYDDNTGSALFYTDFTISSSGDLTINASGDDINIENTNNLNITSHDGGSLGLMLNSVLVTATAAEINYNDVIPGIGAANKSLVLDASSNINSINSLTATTLTGTLATVAQPNITSIGTLSTLDIANNANNFTSLRIDNRDTTPDTSGTEINFGVFRDVSSTHNGATIRCTVKNGDIPQVKGGDLVFLTNTGYSPYPGDGFERMRITQFGVIGINTNNPAKQLEINNSVGSCLRLTRNDTDGSATTYADFDIPASGDLNITPSGTNVSVINSSLNIGNYNGTTIGLKLAGFIVTASAAELNYNDITAIGTAEASKTLVLDSNKDITSINKITTEQILINNALENFNTGGLLINSYSQGYFTGRKIKTEIITTINLTDYNPTGQTDNYSLEIIGYIKPLYTETYTFYISYDDGVRFWIDDSLLYHQWDQIPLTGAATNTIAMTANTYKKIYIQHNELTGNHILKLEWESASQTREVIPSTAFAWDNNTKPDNKLLDNITINNSTSETSKRVQLSVDNLGNTTITSDNAISIESGDYINLKDNVVVGNSGTENNIHFKGTTSDDNKFHAVISERIYTSPQSSELLIYKGGDVDATNGPDRLRYRSSEHRFQTFTSGELFTAYANDNDRLTIINNGNIGINYTTPESLLTIKQNANSETGGLRLIQSGSTNYWSQFLEAGNNYGFSYNGTTRGYISSIATNTQMNFTGQHRNYTNNKKLLDNIENYKGMIVSSTGIYKNLNNDKLTVNDALPIIELSKKNKDKTVFGVISDKEDNLPNRNFSIGIFSTYVDKIEGDERLFINGLGEGMIMVSNIKGSFENGDYITTSILPGYGCKQDDDLVHNYTVAKITQNCDFSKSTRFTDKKGNIITKDKYESSGGYKLMLVGCTYKCS